MTSTSIEELLALVRRDLGADEAILLEPGARVPDGESALSLELPDGRTVVALFSAPPEGRDALARRLGMVAESFRDVLSGHATGPSRPPPPSRSLREELAAVARRADADDAVVIDARSPIVWGATDADEIDDSEEHVEPEGDLERSGAHSGSRAGASAASSGFSPVVGLPEGPAANAPVFEPSHDAPSRPLELAPTSVCARAIATVRHLPELETLHKGGHVHISVSEESFGYVAHSFAGIYVLVLAFSHRFDELRAKRAVIHALPAIESLVMALPPLDPRPPIGGAMAVRRGRRPRR